jgi:hypothetical protein
MARRRHCRGAHLDVAVDHGRPADDGAGRGRTVELHAGAAGSPCSPPGHPTRPDGQRHFADDEGRNAWSRKRSRRWPQLGFVLASDPTLPPRNPGRFTSTRRATLMSAWEPAIVRSGRGEVVPTAANGKNAIHQPSATTASGARCSTSTARAAPARSGVSKINCLGPMKQVIVSPEGAACPLVTPRGEITWRTVRSHTAAMRTQQ